jgi:hypothetical protein
VVATVQRGSVMLQRQPFIQNSDEHRAIVYGLNEFLPQDRKRMAAADAAAAAKRTRYAPGGASSAAAASSSSALGGNYAGTNRSNVNDNKDEDEYNVFQLENESSSALATLDQQVLSWFMDQLPTALIDTKIVYSLSLSLCVFSH